MGLAFLSPEIWEYLLLAFYGLATVALLVYARGDFGRLDWRRWLLLLALLVAPVLIAFLATNGLLVVRFSIPSLLPPPNVPTQPAQPFASLLALPVIIAGAWLGAGPALLVGLLGGILRAGMTTGGVTDPFHFAFFLDVY